MGDGDTLIQSINKAEFIDFVKKNIDSAEKCLVIFGVPNEQKGLTIIGRQLGLSYIYELDGFLGVAYEAFSSEEKQ